MDRSEILFKILADDMEGNKKLYQGLYNWAAVRGFRHQDREDLIQSFYISIVRSIKNSRVELIPGTNFNEISELRKWILRAFNKHIIEEYRKRGKGRGYKKRLKWINIEDLKVNLEDEIKERIGAEITILMLCFNQNT